MDTFLGPPKPLGVIGRLVIERQLAEDGQEVVIALSGLRSETITLAGESAAGKIIGYPVVRQLLCLTRFSRMVCSLSGWMTSRETGKVLPSSSLVAMTGLP